MKRIKFDQRFQIFWLKAVVIFCLSLLSFTIPGAIAPSFAAPVNLAKQRIEELHVDLGNPANELHFVPNQLEFKSGKRYKVVLHNPSAQKHYFTAKDFADSIWTQKVEAGNVEIKGAIHDLELKPGATAEWVFIPVKSGNYELHCSIPGHTEAGMTGAIAVRP